MLDYRAYLHNLVNCRSILILSIIMYPYDAYDAYLLQWRVYTRTYYIVIYIRTADIDILTEA